MITNIAVVTWRWRSGEGIVLVDTQGKRLGRKEVEAINDKLNEITGYGINWFREDDPAASISYEYPVLTL